jgi:hypothetical protein
MFGGYPAIYHEHFAGQIQFRFGWFAAKVQSSSERNVGLQLDIANSIATSSQRIPPNADLGGWSGGPVFRVVEENGIERLELSAII